MCRIERRYILLSILGFLIASIWSACGSNPSSEVLTRDTGPPLTALASADIIIVEKGSPRLARVQPIPGRLLLSPGETIGVSAVAFDQLGREIKGATFSWQLVETQAGNITPSGVFRAGFTEGTFEGAIIVTAQAPANMGPGAVQASASITIHEFEGRLKPVGIRVFPETAEVEQEETLQLMALAVDANGVAVLNMKFKWEMLEPLAGSISQDGRLTASSTIGTFPDTIRVTLVPDKDLTGEEISTSLDMQIMDPASVSHRVSALVLPQVISLRPNEEMKFTTMVLDRRGNQISPVEPRWEILDADVGVISQGGQFTGGEEPGVYSDAIHVSIGVPGAEERIVATATVIILDVTPPVIPESDLKVQLPRVAIFPERVVLSPGESTRVSIVGLQGDIQGISTANIRWSLTPPEVGEVSRFVTVTAANHPGTYEGAIRAEVTLDTEDGPVNHEVSATLIIRDVLASVEITPQVSTLALAEKVQFRAVAYDRNHVMVPDVSFRWTITDPDVGTIDANGMFTAGGRPGEYLDAVQVETTQRRGSSTPGGEPSP